MTSLGIGLGIPFGGGPPPFVPTQLSGCVLWLRADTGITLNGADVSAWADQSGAGNDATQGTAADQPAFSATGGPNGTAGVVFDASNTEFMSLVGMSEASTDRTIFAVVNPAATGAQSVLGSRGPNSVTAALAGTAAEPSIYDGAWRASGTAATTNEQFLTWHLDGTGTTATWYRNGASIGTSALTAFAMGNTCELGRYWTGAYSLDSLVSEVIMYDTALGAAGLAQVHSYLAGRYGI